MSLAHLSWPVLAGLAALVSPGRPGTGAGAGHRDEMPEAEVGSAGARARPMARPAEVRLVAVKVVGAMEEEVARRTVLRSLAAIRFCYEKALVVDPTVGGKMMLHLVVGAAGSVTAADVAGGGLPGAGKRVSDCVVARARTFKFPASGDGASVDLRLPFVFTPGDAYGRPPLVYDDPIDPPVLVPPKPPKPPPAPPACSSAVAPGRPRAALFVTGDAATRAIVGDAACARVEALRACYEIERAGAPGLKGRATLAVVAGAGGVVTKSRVKSSTHGRAALDACLLRIARTIPFDGSIADPTERTFTVELSPPPAGPVP